MIQTEMIGDRIRHYSDAGFKILQVETNVTYDDAVDVLPLKYTYTETDIPIEDGSPEAEPEDYVAALKRLGVMA
jgi:hypothetical protein